MSNLFNVNEINLKKRRGTKRGRRRGEEARDGRDARSTVQDVRGRGTSATTGGGLSSAIDRRLKPGKSGRLFHLFPFPFY